MTATGPYVVTVTTPDREPGAIDRHSGSILAYVSRVAVATPEEASEEAMRLANRLCRTRNERIEYGTYALNLPKSGGSITLPDGTRIEVEATTYERLVLDLRDAIDSYDPTDAEILAAWNAEHGNGAQGAGAA